MKVNKVKKADKNIPEKEYWMKTGGGSLRFAGKRIKRNQIFIAYEKDLPKAFMDTIVKSTRQEYVAQSGEPIEPYLERLKGGQYHVYNQNNQMINPKPVNRRMLKEY